MGVQAWSKQVSVCLCVCLSVCLSVGIDVEMDVGVDVRMGVEAWSKQVSVCGLFHVLLFGAPFKDGLVSFDGTEHCLPM